MDEGKGRPSPAPWGRPRVWPSLPSPCSSHSQPSSSLRPAANPQIFDKALFEPHFCELYSQLCHTLQKRLPEFDDPAEEPAPEGAEAKRRKLNFRRLLLNKCQEEFEKGDAAMAAVAQREAAAKERGGKVRAWGLEQGAGGGGEQGGRGSGLAPASPRASALRAPLHHPAS
jgi:hypothetical protein